MSGYRPPFHINNTMLTCVSDISGKLGNLTAVHGLENRPRLRRNNRIRSIHSSLSIEANSLSLEQVKDVLDGHPVLGDRREIQEVKNAYDAYGMIPEIDPFSLDDLRRVHSVMMRYLIDEAGVFRRGEEGVFDGENCIFMAPPARLVPELMEQLFTWMRQAARERSVHPLILASVFHYEFVFIHPFADGNGRMARLWHTAILAGWQPIFEYIPIENQIEKCQSEYYQAISQCHAKGNSDLFIEFMLRQIDITLSELSEQFPEDETSEYVRRLLAVMEPGIPYTAAALAQKLGLKSRNTLRKNYLHPAMEQNLIRMTIPDRPNSRNQRYVKR